MPDTPSPTCESLQARIDELEAQVARQALDESKTNSKLLGELVDHSLANVFAADRHMRLIAINRTARETFERLHGVIPQVGDSIQDFLGEQPQMLASLQPMWSRVLAGEAFAQSIQLGGGSSARHYDMRYNPLRDAEGEVQGGYLFAYDITERVLEQECLRRTEQALRQSQKMEAIGQLTGGIAHDFNNLLGGIMGALELANTRLDQGRNQDCRHMLGIVQQNAARAASMVQRLLTFARRQTLMPQAVDMHQLVADMHDLIHSSLDTHITFIDATLAGQWMIRVDPPQLESALLNLCINARDAMSRGGTLRISCRNCPLDISQATSLQLPEGDYLLIEVQDTGCGMAQDVAARSMEPFFTTKPLGQGTGLGLSMAYGLMRQSGGHLSVDSTPQNGTTIHLYLPRDHSSAAPLMPAPRQPVHQGEPRAGLSVVLVEDQPALRMVIREVLEDRGHQVQAFAEGDGAVEAAKECAPPALLIVDIGLPGSIDGYEVVSAYRKRAPGVPVLFITGYSSNHDNGKAAALQPSALLHKPFELAVLIAQVDRLLGAVGPPAQAGPPPDTP